MHYLTQGDDIALHCYVVFNRINWWH